MKVEEVVTILEDTGSTRRYITGTIVTVEDTFVEVERGSLLDTVFYVDIVAMSTLTDHNVDTKVGTIRPSKIGVSNV